MSERQPGRVDAPPPVVAAPARFVERRATFRRAADRLAHRETVLLARSLDVLASDADAESRLAGLLDLVARTVGARRAAVVADAGDRRIAVARSRDEDPTDAAALAAWLDAWAPRPRAERAAAGPASVAIVVSGDRSIRRGSASADGSRPAHHYASLPIPAAGRVALGFDFAEASGPLELDQRLPPQLARHAAVGLALVTDQIGRQRELEVLLARDEEQARFVSTVAHELRTPLTGLAGYLDLLVGDQVADETDRREFLERSQQIVATMDDLVGDLLELSKLESGSLRLDLGPFSLAEAGARVVASLKPLALARGVEIRTSLPPRLRSALGDRRRAEQILTNLLANALKFAPSGSVVELAAWFDGSLAVSAVRDEGAGIAVDDRVRIFERFHRLAGHERIAGTGLGLPIARELARAMDGEVDVASVPGSGSSFVLVLPGPVGADPATVLRNLAALLAVEEVRLEERAVLRAIANAGHGPRADPSAATKRHLTSVPLPLDPVADEPSDEPGGPSTDEAATVALRRGGLRAIDGLPPPRPDPSPA